MEELIKQKIKVLKLEVDGIDKTKKENNLTLNDHDVYRKMVIISKIQLLNELLIEIKK